MARFLLLGLLFLSFAISVRAQAPVVEKVDPPEWWTGIPAPGPDGVMLLVRGANFGKAAVTTAHRGVHVERVESTAQGNYLFIWLGIAPAAKPGVVEFEIRNQAGRAILRFPLHARRPPSDGFAGLSADDVIYLIMPDRFADGDPSNNEPPGGAGTYDRNQARAYHGGDLRGIRDRLPYLRDLGITALWLNPVYDNDDTSPSDYHGYGAVDYYGVEEHLGTMSDLQELVAAAHQHGIKVFLDNVPNHCGPKHPWVKNLPTPDWFHGTPEKNLVARSPFEGLVDPNSPPHFWRDLVEGWFAGILPDLNTENPRVAQYLLQNSIWWAEKTAIDGYRLDTFPYVGRRFWSDFHRELFRVYPRMATFGEVFHFDPAVTAYFAAGERNDGMDTRVSTLFDFPLYAALRNVMIRNAPATQIVDVLRRDWMYPQADRLVTFIGNHDVKRLVSESGGSPDKLKLALSLLLTLRGIPQLYTGDEIGMEGGDDPDNRRDFPGGFRGDARDAFTASGRARGEQDVFLHLQRLLQVRREHSALRRGRQWHVLWDDTAYAFVRQDKDERLLVVFNNSSQERNLLMEGAPDTALEGAARLEPLLDAPSATVRGSRIEVNAPPRSVSIYIVK